MELDTDTDAHTLKFWVNGKPHGPGFTSGVTGSLRWALSVGGRFDGQDIWPCVAQIVPSAEIVLQE